MEDLFWGSFLRKDAERIAKKNDEDFDKQSAETKRIIFEMLLEDLDYKYRFE